MELALQSAYVVQYRKLFWPLLRGRRNVHVIEVIGQTRHEAFVLVS